LGKKTTFFRKIKKIKKIKIKQKKKKKDGTIVVFFTIGKRDKKRQC
jgi:hypothetical protein